MAAKSKTKLATKTTRAKAKPKNPFMVNRQAYDKHKVMDYICEKIANSSLGLENILKTSEHQLPSRVSIMSWIGQETDEGRELLNKYTRAKELQADYMAEEMLDIADDATNDYMTVMVGDDERRVIDHEHVQRSRLRIESRKWLMSKLLPKKYGDKMQHSVGLTNLDNLSDDELDAKIRQVAKFLND